MGRGRRHLRGPLEETEKQPAGEAAEKSSLGGIRARVASKEMGRDNQDGAASAIRARTTGSGKRAMKSSREDQTLRARASAVLQPRTVLATAFRLVLECLVQRLTNNNVSGVEQATTHFSNFRMLGLSHAAFRMNPLCTPLCTAALHRSVEHGRPETALQECIGPRIWKRGGWRYRERAALAEYVTNTDAADYRDAWFEDSSSSESATVLGFQRFRCAWWRGRTEQWQKCGYVGGFTNRLAGDPLFKSKLSAIRLKQNLPKCL